MLLFSHWIMSNSLWPHKLQYARLSYPSQSPGACSNSCSLSRWCHPTILSSVVPFFPCLLSFPASRYFLLSWIFTSGGRSIGVSALASVLPMNIQDWFPLGWTGWISLQSKGLSRVFSNTTVLKHQLFKHSAFFMVQLSHPYMIIGKTMVLTRWTFVGKVMSVSFNMLPRFVIAFLPRSKCLLILWLQLPYAVILELKKIKSVTVSIVYPLIYHEVMGPDAMVLAFLILSFKPAFSFSSFIFIKRLLSSSSLSALLSCQVGSKIHHLQMLLFSKA